MSRTCAVVGLLCAWLLWEGTDALQPGAVTPLEWSIMRAFESREVCESAKREQITNAPTLKPLFKMTHKDDHSISLYRDDMVMRFRYSCLPDTIDPRGPTR